MGYLRGLLFGRLYVVMLHMYLPNTATLTYLTYLLSQMVMDIGNTFDYAKMTGQWSKSCSYLEEWGWSTDPTLAENHMGFKNQRSD
jgi:hypothetical protein